jgi:hypothetical protein
VNVAFTQSYETFQAHSIVKVLWFRNEPCPKQQNLLELGNFDLR